MWRIGVFLWLGVYGSMAKFSNCSSKTFYEDAECRDRWVHRDTNQSQIYSREINKIETAAAERAQIGRWLSKQPSALQLEEGGATAALGPRCRRDLQLYRKRLTSLDLWALHMLDANAKISSGILNGNVNQLGDFDQCLAVVYQELGHTIKGKYCLASFQFYLQPNSSDAARTLHRLVHSNYLFRSDIDDTGHRVPQFSSVKWGVCVPASCSGRDLRALLLRQVQPLAARLNVAVDLRTPDHMCTVRDEDQRLPRGTLITAYLFGMLLILISCATACDIYGDDMSPYLRAFSLKLNIIKMLDVSKSSDDISCINGVRFFNSIMLIISHKSMAIMFLPFVNRTLMAENVSKPWTVMSRAASLYTDPFIMCSGLLTTHALLKRLHRRGSIHLPTEYLSRIVRILPSFAALILFCTWIAPYISSGPYWKQVVSYHATICKQYWWRNMMFIHNYFGFENMCLTHTHHVGIDMQLFLVTPPLVLALWRWPLVVTRILVALAAASTVARYAVTYALGLSNYVSFGISIKQLFATADYMYILPPYRATVYIMGIILGYLLHNSHKTVLSKSHLRMGWAVAVALLGVSFAGTQAMSSATYTYEPAQAANYAALAPVTWCAFFAWAIYTSHLGYTSWVSKILSWRWFSVWTKISYAVYLTQFPVFFYFVGVTRAPISFSTIEQLVDVREYFYIIVTAVLLTLVVEMPFNNLRNSLLRNSDSKNITRNTKTDEMIQEKSNIDKLINAVEIVKKFSHREDYKIQ